MTLGQTVTIKSELGEPAVGMICQTPKGPADHPNYWYEPEDDTQYVRFKDGYILSARLTDMTPVDVVYTFEPARLLPVARLQWYGRMIVCRNGELGIGISTGAHDYHCPYKQLSTHVTLAMLTGPQAGKLVIRKRAGLRVLSRNDALLWYQPQEDAR